MTTILLARHGETDWNRDHRWQGHADPPLNDTGRVQAGELARALVAANPDGVVSSDLRRAQETAEIVATTLGLGLSLDDRLREVDVGEWSGLTTAEVEARYPAGAARRRAGGTGWEHGESYEAMAARVVAVLQELAAARPQARLVVITHGGPMRAVWAAAGEAPDKRPRYGNCALEELTIESGRIRRIHSRERGGLHKQVQG